MKMPEMKKHRRRSWTFFFHDSLPSASCSPVGSGDTVSSTARLANEAGMVPDCSVPFPAAALPCRTLIRTAVLNPLGNLSFSLIMT